MAYGCEIENYDPRMLSERGAHTDGANLYEIPSPVFPSLKEMLEWFNSKAEVYDFVYHSYPDEDAVSFGVPRECELGGMRTCTTCNGNGVITLGDGREIVCEDCNGGGEYECSESCEGCPHYVPSEGTSEGLDSCSLHLHVSPLISYEKYVSLFRVLSRFRWCFYNAPMVRFNSGERRVVLSSRHFLHHHWCERRRQNKEFWDLAHREHLAVTSTRRNCVKHMEFRYLDFPRNPDQIVIFPYLVKLVESKNFPSLRRLADVVYLKDLKNEQSRILENCRKLNNSFPKMKFWSFNTKGYELIGDLIKNLYDEAVRSYEEYAEDPDDRKWSNIFRRKWNQEIPHSPLCENELEREKWDRFFADLAEANRFLKRGW